MKAKIITMTVYEGIMDWSHGGGFTQARLLIPDANNLLVWLHQKNVCIEANFDPDKSEEYQVEREVDLPDDLVKALLDFQQTRQTLHQRIGEHLPNEG